MPKYVDVDVLRETLVADMKRAGRGAFRPDEIPLLVMSAIERIGTWSPGHDKAGHGRRAGFGQT